MSDRRDDHEKRQDDLELRLRKRYRLRQNWPNASSVSIHLVVGLIVVILGVLTLLNNIDLIQIRSPMRYFWSAVFLSIGSALVIENRTDRTWKWGIGWIVLGVWTFAHTSGWIDFGIWDLFWPIFLLAAGGYLVRRAILEREQPPNSSSTLDTNSSTQSEFNSAADSANSDPPPYNERTVRGIGILSGSELKPSTQAMERAELFALMGGVKLDLYDTQLRNDAATINVAACMGGIEILVPSEWTVVSNVLPLMGAFIDKRRPAAATTMGVTTTKKTLTINGFVLMGGIEVKN